MKIKTVRISAKCSDLCSTQLLDEAGKVVGEKDGYVPNFMPEEHYGEYVMLDIDVATGRILNWNPPTDKEMLADMKGVIE